MNLFHINVNVCYILSFILSSTSLIHIWSYQCPTRLTPFRQAKETERSPSDASTDVGSLSRYHQEEVRRSIQKSSINFSWRVGFQQCLGGNQQLQENCIQRLHGLLLLARRHQWWYRKTTQHQRPLVFLSFFNCKGGWRPLIGRECLKNWISHYQCMWLMIAIDCMYCICYTTYNNLLMLMPSFLGHHRTETKKVKPKKQLLNTLLKYAKMTYISPDLEDCRQKMHWRFLTARTLHVKLSKMIFLQSDQHRNTALISCPCFWPCFVIGQAL